MVFLDGIAGNAQTPPMFQNCMEHMQLKYFLLLFQSPPIRLFILLRILCVCSSSLLAYFSPRVTSMIFFGNSLTKNVIAVPGGAAPNLKFIVEDHSPGLISINRKCLSYSSYIKCMENCLSYNFRAISKSSWKNIKTNFCGCLIIIKSLVIGFCFLKKLLIIQFPHMEIVWLAFSWLRHKNFSKLFWDCPKTFITFFKNARNSYFFLWHVYVCLDQCLIT